MSPDSVAASGVYVLPLTPQISGSVAVVLAGLHVLHVAFVSVAVVAFVPSTSGVSIWNMLSFVVHADPDTQKPFEQIPEAVH